MQANPSNLRLADRPSGKRCPRCRAVKPAGAFYLRRSGHLSSYCRTCQRAASRESRQRRRQNPAALEELRAVERRRKRRNRALLARTSSAHGLGVAQLRQVVTEPPAPPSIPA
jgi:hypothetical protein